MTANDQWPIETSAGSDTLKGRHHIRFLSVSGMTDGQTFTVTDGRGRAVATIEYNGVAYPIGFPIDDLTWVRSSDGTLYIHKGEIGAYGRTNYQP